MTVSQEWRLIAASVGGPVVLFSDPQLLCLMHPNEMQLSKREHEKIIEGVIMLLNQLDPYEVAPGDPDGAPRDEYVSEAHPMASLLINSGSITIDQIDTIWQKWFGEPLSVAIGATRAEQFASTLNALINSAH